MRLRLPLPDTLFARLFAAIVAVLGATLLIIVVLIVRERRELALLESGTGAFATAIVETSEDLARLPRPERAQASASLRERRLLLDDEMRPLRRPPPPREDPRELERSFATQVQKRLGGEYAVHVGPPSASRDDVIMMHATGMRDGPPPDFGSKGTDGPGGLGRPGGRMFDVTVALPDGEQVVFRAPAPRPGPRLPRRIFIELGVVTLVLSIVLYAMTRTITRPLAQLARAADALGRGTSVPHLEERGARELRGATRAFNAMQERLQRYLDSRTRVLAAMSHDLRTPLTRLRLRVESIENEQLRQKCETDLDEMASMVRGALSMFRGLNDDEVPCEIDVNALVQQIHEQHLEVDEDVSTRGRAEASFWGKPLALKRCLSNLVGNALQYGLRATIHIEDGKALVIRVCDEGPGVPKDLLEQVFEPFFRLESSRNRDTGGTGLGLSIARDIAQAHGGSLVLSNRKEGGLMATLTLPRVARSVK
jgi:signal transduction histidine kinase